MLTISNLTVSYGKHKVLENISLNLTLGQIHGFAGLNGSGKTTLLNTIFGFVVPDNGQVQIGQKPIEKGSIGYLETQNYLYHRLTISEFVGLFVSNSLVKFELNDWMKVLNLNGNEVTDELSTGMRKKVALLCLIAQDKNLLLLDEPFNGLDMESVLILNLVLKELKKAGKTILITSHIIETLTENCDQIHTLVQGKIEASYFPNDFEKLKTEFLGDFMVKASTQVENLF